MKYRTFVLETLTDNLESRALMELSLHFREYSLQLFVVFYSILCFQLFLYASLKSTISNPVWLFSSYSHLNMLTVWDCVIRSPACGRIHCKLSLPPCTWGLLFLQTLFIYLSKLLLMWTEPACHGCEWNLTLDVHLKKVIWSLASVHQYYLPFIIIQEIFWTLISVTLFTSALMKFPVEVSQEELLQVDLR